MLKNGLLHILDFLTTLRGWVAQLNGWLGLPEEFLYFLLFGLSGLGLYFLVRPIIRSLAQRGNENVISWAYALTLLAGLLFVVEISRLMTDGSSIAPAELLYALGGYLVLFAVYLVLYWIFRLLRKLFRKR